MHLTQGSHAATTAPAASEARPEIPTSRAIAYALAVVAGVSLIGMWLIWQTGLACGDSSTALTVTGLQAVLDPITPDTFQATNGVTGEGCQ